MRRRVPVGGSTRWDRTAPGTGTLARHRNSMLDMKMPDWLYARIVMRTRHTVSEATSEGFHFAMGAGEAVRLMVRLSSMSKIN